MTMAIASMAVPDHEVVSYLFSFIAKLDYPAMIDFFITFRSKLATESLFDLLVEHYRLLDTALGHGTSARDRKVRLFVSIRHWILNYYADDFLPNKQLHDKMEAFLRSLGGVGQDEISVEGRISKDLYSAWTTAKANGSAHHQTRRYSQVLCERTSFVYNKSSRRQPQTTRPVSTENEENISGSHKPKRFHRMRRPLRDALAEDPAVMQRMVLKNISTNVTVPNLCPSIVSDQQQELMDSCSQTAEIKEHPCKQNPDLPSSNDESAVERLEVAPKTPLRTLRRRPGGDLATARTITEMSPVARRASSTTGSCETECYSILNKTADEQFEYKRRDNRLKALTPDGCEFLRNLREVFDRGTQLHDEEQSPATAMQTTLSRLEGRCGSSNKRRASSMVADSDLDYTARADIAQDDSPVLSLRTEKRRRRLTTMHDEISSSSSSGLVSSEQATAPWLAAANTILFTTSSGGDATSIELSLGDALQLPAALTVGERQYTFDHDCTPWICRQNSATIAQALTSIEALVFLECDWLELGSGSWLQTSSAILGLDQWEDVMARQVTGLNFTLARFACATASVSRCILAATTSQLQSRVLASTLR